MKNIALSKDIKNIIVNVSQKILDKNILNFSYSSLELNSINYNPSDIIYCTFLKYSNQYQIFVFKNSFTSMIFELLHNNEDSGFTLYITKEFFVIYEKSKLYTYQNINQEYSKEELLQYINKNFNISVSNIIKLDEQEINEIIKNKKLNSNISVFKNINIKSNKSFLIYIFYLFICIFATFYYQEFKEESQKEDIYLKQKLAKDEYLKTIKQLKFNSYEKEYEKLIKTIDKLGLKLISLTYSSSIMKIKVHSKNKNSIYLFLNEYKKNLQSNNINKLDSLNIFESVINVKINRK